MLKGTINVNYKQIKKCRLAQMHARVAERMPGSGRVACHLYRR